jgi:hypothetical protein
MTQLAKHWSHKFEVAFDDRQARIDLPAGRLDMRADPEGLALVLDAEDEATVARLEGVVADHLARFAFREPEMKLNWVRA